MSGLRQLPRPAASSRPAGHRSIWIVSSMDVPNATKTARAPRPGRSAFGWSVDGGPRSAPSKANRDERRSSAVPAPQGHGSLARRVRGYNQVAVPELPDLVVVTEAFHAGLSGRRIERAEAPAPLAVRGTPAELAALRGQRVARVSRRGKFIVIDLDRDRIAVNAMLTGRLQMVAPDVPLPPA